MTDRLIVINLASSPSITGIADAVVVLLGLFRYNVKPKRAKEDDLGTRSSPAILAVALMLCITTTALAVEYRVTELFSGSYVAAADINDYGQIACSTGTESGVLWKDGIVADVVSSDRGYCTPMAINNQGQVVGASPFLWEGDQFNRLPSLGLPFNDFDYALDINDHGQVVGQVDNRAVIWDNGEIKSLDSGLSAANGINDSGQIAGFISGDS